MDSAEILVENRLADEHSLAEGMRRSAQSKEKIEVRSFFNDVFSSCTVPWSNVPMAPAGIREATYRIKRQIDLASHLISGSAAIVDLEPLPPRDFELQYGMRIRDVEALSDLGRVYPNLYVRDPAQWRGFDHLAGLIKRSFSMGERVEAYMRVVDPAFDPLSWYDYFFNFLVRCRSERPDEYEEIRATARGSSDSVVARILCTWKAYLIATDPALCADIDGLADEGRFADAYWLMRIRKQYYVSGVTASAGGKFSYDARDKELFERYPVAIKGEQREIDVTDADRQRIMSFLHTELISPSSFYVETYQFTDAELKKIINLVTSREYSEIVTKLEAACDQMLSDLQNGAIPTSRFLDLQLHYNSQVSLIEGHKLGAQKLVDFGKWATRAGGGVGGAALEVVLGGEFGGVAGALVGGGLGWWLGNKVEQISMREAIYSWHDPRRYRLYEVRRLSERLRG